MSESSSLDQFNVTVAERIQYIISGKPEIVCPLGNKRTLRNDVYGFCGSTGSCACFREHLSQKFESRDMSQVVTKRKETWIAKYGVDNPAKNKQIQQKRKHTIDHRDNTDTFSKLAENLQSNGFKQVVNRLKGTVTPLFTRDEYYGSRRSNKYQWKCVHCNSVLVSHVDYGTTPRCNECFPKTVSKGEQEIADFVKTLVHNVITNTKSVISPLELDIYIPEKKVAIEFNGVYWHSTAKRPNDYHVKKFIMCREQGIHLIQIFEDEWHSRPDVIKQRLKNILGVSDKFYARQTTVKHLTASEYRTFTESTHLRGYAAATHKLGLFVNDTLVAVMSFSKSRYTSDQYELVRYCSSGTVVGGASKLLAHFVRENNPTNIVTYADRCWSNGNLYRTIGFVDVTHDDQNTGYWYVKDNQRYHRSSFTKANLVRAGHPPEMTESEIMSSLGYLTIYDCGNYKFMWSKAGKNAG